MKTASCFSSIKDTVQFLKWTLPSPSLKSAKKSFSQGAQGMLSALTSIGCCLKKRQQCPSFDYDVDMDDYSRDLNSYFSTENEEASNYNFNFNQLPQSYSYFASVFAILNKEEFKVEEGEEDAVNITPNDANLSALMKQQNN